MFFNPFNKESSRVFLGSLIVAKRSELKKSDEWGLTKSFDLQAELKARLDEVITLQHVSDVEDLASTDLVLDITVVSAQSGEFDAAVLQGMGTLPIWWRPKVEVRAKLYYAISGKTKAEVCMKEKMPWKEYLAGVLTINGLLFRYKARAC